MNRPKFSLPEAHRPRHQALFLVIGAFLAFVCVLLFFAIPRMEKQISRLGRWEDPKEVGRVQYHYLPEAPHGSRVEIQPAIMVIEEAQFGWLLVHQVPTAFHAIDACYTVYDAQIGAWVDVGPNGPVAFANHKGQVLNKNSHVGRRSEQKLSQSPTRAGTIRLLHSEQGTLFFIGGIEKAASGWRLCD